MTGSTAVATYRVQLRPGWGFDEAAAVVGYLHQLGVSHLYTSPVTASEPGSVHGYDVVDPTRVDDELGGSAGLERLRASLGRVGMGHLVDVVPNHVSVASEANRWWWDVLARGRDSEHARAFDVEWDAPGAEGRVVLPVLGAPLAEERDGLAVRRRDAELVLCWRDRCFPLSAASGDLLPPGDPPPEGWRAGDELLAAQHYRLAWWREEGAPNYRRFFDIDGLAGLRLEDPAVVDAVGSLVARWAADPVFSGVRLDHVDGLADPAGVTRRYRELVGPDRLVVVEKILEADEELPDDWGADGTTGYELIDALGGLFVDPAAVPVLDAVATAVTGSSPDWAATVEASQDVVLRQLLVPEVRRLARDLGDALRARGQEPGSPEARQEAVRALLEGIGRYRTYLVEPDPPTAGDRVRIEAAAERAAALGHVDDAMVRRLAAVLVDPSGPHDWALVRRFQQTTPPVRAKAVEDTAFYRYPRLVSRNEVGADPSRPAWSPEDFHAAMVRRGRWRAPLNPLSTHDTKRSADVRARITAISLFPEEWAEALADLRRAAGSPGGGAPGDEIELLAWQTLVGAWPIEADRLVAALVKSAREAKQRTSWHDPDDRYETALVAWCRDVLADPGIVARLERFVDAIREAGALISLAATTLQLTVPGVPDIYQGTEAGDRSLVDPDNRRDVDFERLARRLAGLDGADPAEVWSVDPEGSAQLLVIHRLLRLRGAQPSWFASAAGYHPRPVGGPEASTVVAFDRGGEVVTIVPRLRRAHRPGPEAQIELPGSGTWRDVITGAEYDGATVGAAAVWHRFPVAVLARVADDTAGGSPG